jgi:hypothetical protein
VAERVDSEQQLHLIFLVHLPLQSAQAEREFQKQLVVMVQILFSHRLHQQAAAVGPQLQQQAHHLRELQEEALAELQLGTQQVILRAQLHHHLDKVTLAVEFLALAVMDKLALAVVVRVPLALMEIQTDPLAALAAQEVLIHIPGLL